VNFTRTRVARALMVGATIAMTVGLAFSGLTAAATAPEPPTAEQVAPDEPANRGAGRTTDHRTGGRSCVTDHRSSSTAGSTDERNHRQ
jgi:hypothetical protein